MDVRDPQGPMVDSIDEVEWIQEKDDIRKEKSSMIRIEGGNRRKGFPACEMQSLTGGHFMWDDEVRGDDAPMIRKMKKIGAGQVRVGNRRLWTNSGVIIRKVMEEKERRKWRREKGIKPEETKSWKSIARGYDTPSGREREMDEFEKIRRAPGRLHLSKGDEESESAVYYMDSEGEFWDEISKKKLNKNGVIAARLEEIKQVHPHGAYEKVTLEECWNQTGKGSIKTKWVDINTGDELNEELRSRLVAKEIKTDKRTDLFAATPPLEAKKILLSQAVTEGIGYTAGQEESGMKMDFIDISRADFQADAIRNVYVALLEEDASPGMCGKLMKSTYGTRDPAQNWGEAYSAFMKEKRFLRGRSSPCVFWNPSRELRCVVHGDDLTILGWKKDLDWFCKEIGENSSPNAEGDWDPAKGTIKKSESSTGL